MPKKRRYRGKGKPKPLTPEATRASAAAVLTRMLESCTDPKEARRLADRILKLTATPRGAKSVLAYIDTQGAQEARERRIAAFKPFSYGRPEPAVNALPEGYSEQAAKGTSTPIACPPSPQSPAASPAASPASPASPDALQAASPPIDEMDVPKKEVPRTVPTDLLAELEAGRQWRAFLKCTGTLDRDTADMLKRVYELPRALRSEYQQALLGDFLREHGLVEIPEVDPVTPVEAPTPPRPAPAPAASNRFRPFPLLPTCDYNVQDSRIIRSNAPDVKDGYWEEKVIYPAEGRYEID